MKPTIVTRASEKKPTLLLVSYPLVTLPLDEQIREQTGEINRVLALIHGRLERIEQRLTALEQKGK